jgi:A/G-specific adenine glycosylase
VEAGPSFDREGLASWASTVERDLPWRSMRDPWPVLVSEVMAQQTPVARVVPHWERFMSLWPTPPDLAVAPLAGVLDVWSGLGYPRRARWLREAALQMVERHGGNVPSGIDDLLALPGIGPYTARAVAVFAHEADVGLVDTNIARILARWGGRRLTPAGAQTAADALVPAGGSWEHNAALMDLGALICRPNPHCDRCPLLEGCRFGSGAVAEDPAPGSAGVSRSQARFEGSVRQARGALLEALRSGPVLRRRVAAVIDRDGEVAAVVVDGLIHDGLVIAADGTLELAP